ncbi:DUF5937 family protein [Kribbella sp. CA-294648]|uniref:DUF5937 family protein n=1 Tax=Kribbella sp. CA-294648 TaxID=3239948 RepID=UPI003D93FDD6
MNFDEQLASIRGLPPEDLAAELSQTVVDTTRYSGRDLVHNAVVRNAALAELDQMNPRRADVLRNILADPTPALDTSLTALEDYWNAALAAEWERIEPGLYNVLAHAGQRIAHEGVFPMLRYPCFADPDRSHPPSAASRPSAPARHHCYARAAGDLHGQPLRRPPVRVTCDDPWPLRVTYPVAPLAPVLQTATANNVGTG